MNTIGMESEQAADGEVPSGWHHCAVGGMTFLIESRFTPRGKLGHGDARFQWLPTRVRALNGVKVASIAAGESHALCATREGKVYAWGSGALGLTPPQLTELHAADATSQVGSAGNYEWAYGESLLNRQAHLPQLVDLS